MKNSLIALFLCSAITYGQLPYWNYIENSDTLSFFSFAANQNSHLFASSHPGGIVRSIDNGESWEIIWDSTMNTIVYSIAVNVSGHIFAATATRTEGEFGFYVGKIICSTDNGLTWYSPDKNLNRDLINVLKIDGSNTIYGGGYNGNIYRSTDNGRSWEKVRSGILGDNIRCISFNSKGYIYAGSFTGDSTGNIYFSTNNGNSWDTSTSIHRSISSLACGNGDTMYAGTYNFPLVDGGIFKSVDDGKTWAQVGLHNMWIRSIRISGTNIFACPENNGVFLSTNSGTSWDSVNSGLHITNVNDVIIAKNGFVFLGTNHGIYRSNQPITNIEQFESNIYSNYYLSQNFPNPFNPITTINYFIPHPSYVIIKVYDLLGREVKILINNLEHQGLKTIRFNVSDLPSGIYLYKIQAGSFIDFKKMILLK